jgi:hypothetical protein
MDVHGAALNDVESARGIALMEKVFAFGQRFNHRDCGDVIKVLRWNSREELATPQCMDESDFLKLSQGGHRGESQPASRQK